MGSFFLGGGDCVVGRKFLASSCACKLHSGRIWLLELHWIGFEIEIFNTHLRPVGDSGFRFVFGLLFLFFCWPQIQAKTEAPGVSVGRTSHNNIYLPFRPADPYLFCIYSLSFPFFIFSVISEGSSSALPGDGDWVHWRVQEISNFKLRNQAQITKTDTKTKPRHTVAK